MPPQLVKVWPREVIVESITDALGIVAELEPPDDLRLESFKAALQMTCQRQLEQPGFGIARPGINGLT